MGEAPVGYERSAGPAEWTAIERSPEFQKLVAARRRLVTGLMALTTLAFAAYLLLLIFGGDGFLGDGMIGSFTWGMALVVVMTVITFVLTAVYSRASNRELDPLAERVRASVQRDRRRVRREREPRWE